jgi:hypothetical protein
LDDKVVKPVLKFPGVLELLNADALDNDALKAAFKARM